MFGTNVMVTVAKSFEAPIKCKYIYYNISVQFKFWFLMSQQHKFQDWKDKFKILFSVVFPQDLLEKGLAASNFAMLGLGDIVIPGIFIALLLRFDVR